ncbi:MAG TPA: ATP-binding protein [Planctomycetaceae bacterium]|nr:ATP-binding protein [Planctomycetaceae bacterium]
MRRRVVPPMKLDEYLSDTEACRRAASAALGVPVRPFDLDWETECKLRSHLRRDWRRGLAGSDALLSLSLRPQATELLVGLECSRIRGVNPPLRLLKLFVPWSCKISDVWYVATEDFTRAYRWIRRLAKQTEKITPPVLRDEEREQLWNNTLGFLQHTTRLLRDYGVPQKRGVLLLGDPGNGKTMACRWLQAHCRRLGLYWRDVTPQDYTQHQQNGEIRGLFELAGPGVILFDDFDQMIRHRDDVGASADLTMLLTQLDGLYPHEGVVYVFTSNARLEEIDPAFRRPGRMDLVLRLNSPDATLRRRLIQEHWHPDIVSGLDVSRVVAQTDGLSFAALEEVKRQLVLNRMHTGHWDWSRAWKAFESARSEQGDAPRFGFHAVLADRDE